MLHVKTCYSFSELSEDQKRSYIEKRPQEFEPYDGWFESTIEANKYALEMVGFSDVKIGFSGFWSQGDGAHFAGNYRYKKGALALVKKEYPQWDDLHLLVKELQELEKKYFYSIRFSISHSGHYQHENCTSFDFEDVRNNHGYTNPNFEEKPFKDACRSFMQDIYYSLQKEYEYLSSVEYILENSDLFDYIEISEYEYEQLIEG